ncbi:MAG TPA: DUF4251 domain-containing protein [Puia sp.]|jgi:hypothetical protein
MQIDRGWTACNPILVAVEAEDHKIAKSNPEINNKTLFFINESINNMKVQSYLGTLILSSFLFCSLSAHSQDKNAEKTARIKALVESQNYIFTPTTALPMSGRTRQLTPDFDLKVTKTVIVSYLPYFGRAYTAPLDPTKGPLNFTSKDFAYTATPRNKGGWNIIIKPKDYKNVQQMSFTISSDGYATLQVNSINNQPISFYGNIQAPKNRR